MSAPQPERQVRCLTQERQSVSMAGQLAHGTFGKHTCSKSLAHEGDHLCGGMTGCGATWPRKS